jgi:putative oxidoreductase
MMNPAKPWLLCGAVLSGIAAVLHVAIIVGGAEWYRFFGAGERMARMAARGAPYPTAVTSFIAAMLTVWMLYALSGAGVIRPLPFLRLGLALIAAVFLARGVLGIPAVLWVDHPYTNELKARMTFMAVSSGICLVVGLCYLVGAARLHGAGPPVG